MDANEFVNGIKLMKIIHKIGINPDDTQKSIFKKFGVDLTSVNGVTTVELDEDSLAYQSLKPHIIKWQLFDAVGVLFTAEEMNAAHLFAFGGCWANGYPMPDNDGSYKVLTYDDKDYCSECGMGLIQKEPFRLKKEPNWGNKNMFMLNWIYDEIFVKKDLFESVFRAEGLDMLPVLFYKKETVLKDTVQLIIPTTNTSLKLANYEYKICQVCNRKKYNIISNGMFPPFEKEVTDHSLFKSKEYFGTGTNARKYIFLTADIRKQLLKYKVKINLIPFRTDL